MPDNKDDLPRVLVLCDEPINTISGGGVTMGNLFRGWPKESLGQIWAHHRFEIDKGVCSNYLRLGAHRMPGDRWAPEALRRRRRLVQRLRPLLRPGLRMPYAQVLAWARQFAPEVIYSQATPYPMYTWWLPRLLARDLHVPLVNHIMDDWPTALPLEWPSVIRPALRRVLQGQLQRLFAAGALNLAISDEMASAFGTRYGRPFLTFHNVIDPDEWKSPKSDYAIRGGVLRVVYLGALAEDNQVYSLREVAQAIGLLRERGLSIQMTVHTNDIYRGCYRQYLGDLPGVEHGGSVTRERLCGTLAQADLLVLPVNFDQRSLAMVQYSMPTKVPEYMASGTPVLVYAPAHVPAAAYARREGWGFVVSERDQRALVDALTTLFESEGLRARLGQRGRQLALLNHNAHTQRERFRDLLRTVAATSAGVGTTAASG